MPISSKKFASLIGRSPVETRKRWKRSSLAAAFLTIACIAGPVRPATAQPCSAYPYTFANGTTADANQVNSNFSSILTCANGSLAPLASPTFTGTLTTPNLIDSGGTANTLTYLNGTKQLSSATVSSPLSFSTGTLSLGTVGASNGGTGHSSYTTGDLLYASGSTTLSTLAGVATGNVLTSGGVATAPTWGKVALGSAVSGTLPVANGGTGSSTDVTNGVAYYDGTALVTGSLLTWNGSMLGVGTSAPTSALTVEGGGRIHKASGEVDLNLVTDDSSVVSLRYLNNTITWRAGIQNTSDYAVRDVTDSTTPLTIQASAPTNTIYVTSGGSVGIGTATPDKSLEVVGGGHITGVLTVDSTGTTSITSAGGISAQLPGHTGTVNYVCVRSSGVFESDTAACNGSSERFKKNIVLLDNTSGLSEVLALQPVSFFYKQGYGDNGAAKWVGFVAEQAQPIDPRLVPVGTDGLPWSFNYQNYTAVLTKAIQQTNSILDVSVVAATHAAPTLKTLYQGQSRPAISVDRQGKIGIGTVTPMQALEVNGQVKIDALSSAAMTSVCQTGGVLSDCRSSLRDEQNVKTAEFGLGEVMQLRPVTFDWRAGGERDFGLVADEVAKVNPLLVTYEDGKVEGVKYAQLTAVLVNAIKQLKSQNDSQAAQILALQNRLSQLERGMGGRRTAANDNTRQSVSGAPNNSAR